MGDFYYGNEDSTPAKCRQPDCYVPDLIDLTKYILSTAHFTVQDGRVCTYCCHGHLVPANGHVFKVISDNRQKWGIPRSRVSRVTDAIVTRIKRMLADV